MDRRGQGTNPRHQEGDQEPEGDRTRGHQEDLGAVDTETGDNMETTEVVRSVEAVITQAMDPNDTRKAMKDTSIKATNAIGEAPNAVEAVIGTKNLINTTQDLYNL